MKIIVRYTIFGVMRTFLITLIIFTFFFILIIGANEAMSQGVSLGTMLLMVPGLIPMSLRYSIPMTLLLATTTFYAKMAGANEVLALKSLGISPWRLIWPVLLVAFIVSLITVYINDIAVSWGQKEITRVLANSAEQIIFNHLKTKKSYDGLNNVTIMVQGVDNKTLIMPTVITGGKNSRRITADRAELELDNESKELDITLYNVEISGDNHQTGYMPIFHERISIASILKIGRDDNHPSEMAMSRISPAIEEQKRAIEETRRRMATQVAFAVCLGDFEQLASPQWNENEKSLEHQHDRLSRLRTEKPRRWASGFTCFFFAWIGAPLAIWLSGWLGKKSNVFSSFFACYIPILIIYYPLLIVGFSLAKNGTTPLICWIANACIGLIGCVFFKRIDRF